MGAGFEKALELRDDPSRQGLAEVVGPTGKLSPCPLDRQGTSVVT